MTQQQTKELNLFKQLISKWRDDIILELNWQETYEDQDQEENLFAKWVSKNQIELRKTNYHNDKPLMTTDYMFKRKETYPKISSSTATSSSAAAATSILKPSPKSRFLGSTSSKPTFASVDSFMYSQNMRNGNM